MVSFSNVLGGRETLRVHNIEAQREAAPLRRIYEYEIAEPLRALQRERIDLARDAYRERETRDASCSQSKRSSTRDVKPSFNEEERRGNLS